MEDLGEALCRCIVVINNAVTGNTISEEHADAYVAAKPWVYDGSVYMPIRYFTAHPNSHCAIMRFDPQYGENPGWTILQPEARVLSGQATLTSLSDVSVSVAQNGNETLVPFAGLDRFSAPGVQDDPTDPANVVDTVGVDGYRFTANNRDRFTTATVSGYTYLSGGCVMQFDGRRAVEAGFWTFPDLTSANFTVEESGSMPAGVYTYAFVWEWPDYLGNRHQSAWRSIAVTVPVSSGSGGGDVGSVAIEMPQEMSQSCKPWRTFGTDARPITLAIYRSEPDETQLFRLEGTGVSRFLDSPRGQLTGSFGTWTDTYDSETIALTSREMLYGSVGQTELLNEAIPASNIMVEHDNRLWFVLAEDPTVCGYSKQHFAGIGIAWNRTLVVQFPEPIVALVPQDGNLVAFSRAGNVYTVIGRPNDNAGLSQGYEPPKLLSVDRQSINSRAIVSCPDGVFYESPRGLEILPRGGQQVEFYGELVRDTLAAFPVITSALHVERDSEVLFACMVSESAGQAGRVIAYSYLHKQWFIRNYQGKGISSMTDHLGGVVFGVYDSDSAMTLWKEAAPFVDGNGSYIPWSLETGDIRLGGVGGRQSVWYLTLVGQVFARETLTISESIDGGQTFDGERIFAQPSAINTWERQYQVLNRKSDTIRIRMLSSQNTDAASRGIGLLSMKITGNPLRGRSRLPASMEA
jgi:hypothetical protein